MRQEADGGDELWPDLQDDWERSRRSGVCWHDELSDWGGLIPDDRQWENFFVLFHYSIAWALVTSGDSLFVTFPFGDSLISRNKTAKVAARACLLETTEPAVIHTSSHRGFALLSTDFRQSTFSRSLSFPCHPSGYFASNVLPT